MDRTEFVIVTTLVLFVAFLLGWVASWLVGRLSTVTNENMDDLDHMAHALHEAEDQRDQAIAYLHQREAELTNRLNQTEAELRATMEGLRDSRAEADDLRAYVERMSAQ